MRPTTLVVGVGSPHGDDQIGWRVANAAAGRGWAGVQAIAVGEPLAMLPHLERCRRLILVDAGQTGSEPGTLTLLRWPDDRLALGRAHSSHGLGVAEVLALAESLGRLPVEVTVLLVEASRLDPGADVCQATARAVPGACDFLEAILRDEVLVNDRQACVPPGDLVAG